MRYRPHLIRWSGADRMPLSQAARAHRWLRERYWTHPLIAGMVALFWLLVRCGTKPSRLSYPCQQAAMNTATTVFGGPFVAALLALARHFPAVRQAARRKWYLAGAAILTLAAAFYTSAPRAMSGPTAASDAQTPEGYQASLFVLDDANGPSGQSYQGLDDLILWMGAGGLKFYSSEATSNFESGPGGIIGPNDVVVIKINYQWDERGGTNVDLLRGLIRRIVDHPDGFVGEIAVCENAQFNPVSNFDRPYNNAEDPARSPHDVVTEFQGLGITISHFDWTAVRGVSVGEYSSGDMRDGYIVYPYDATLNGRVSYPKFRTSFGTYVSLKYGLWDPGAASYDRSRLKFINVPVLKSHHATYGATACVKHYMGVVTGLLSTNSHSAIAAGILGAVLGEIHLADLNILDCIWINANPYSGPATTYAGATRINKLIAGVDPVAIDIWATKNVLIPAFVNNGYSPPWPSPSADPDNPSSAFRIYLDRSMSRILSAGYSVTNDLARISALRWNGDRGLPGDINADGALDARDIQPFVDTMVGANPQPERLLRCDLDGDRDLDGDDVKQLIDFLMQP